MAIDQIKGNSEQIIGQIKDKWGKLTNDEIMSVKGNWQNLAGIVRERYGMAKDKAEQEVNNFLKTIEDKMGGGVMESMKENFEQATETVKENFNEASEAIVSYVKKKPVASLGIAFAAGVLLSLIVRS
jgi:uncharacterized protein YjbJ (UPF0337 family)